VTELAALRGLVAAYTLRQVLHEEKSISRRELRDAMARLAFECRAGFGDRDCVTALALVQLRIQLLLDGGNGRISTQENAADFQVALRALSALIERLWALANAARHPGSVSSSPLA
jgi:hypothetical protein